MAHTTIERFASELKMPSGVLLEQLAKAGVAGKKEGDKLSEIDKTKLLEFLQKQHGAAGEPKKLRQRPLPRRLPRLHRQLLRRRSRKPSPR